MRDGVFFPDVSLSTLQRLEANGLVEQVMGDGVYPYGGGGIVNSTDAVCKMCGGRLDPPIGGLCWRCEPDERKPRKLERPRSGGGIVITFTVPAVPVSQPRPRAVVRGNHAGVVGAPTKHPVHAFKATVRHAFAALHQGQPLDNCDLSLRIVFVMPRPSNMIWKTKTMPRIPYRVKKNDWDNLGKSVCDALNGLAWADDGLIHSATVERWYAAGNEQPHCEVTIQRLESAA